jgi:hypothetical protein
MINHPPSDNYTPGTKSRLDFYRESQLVTNYERLTRQLNRLHILRNQAKLLGLFEVVEEFDSLIAERAALLNVDIGGMG